MIISIASGKGGTGKTTLAAALSLSLDNVQLLDCDVEEPNTHLFLHPEFSGEQDATLPVPQVNHSLCDTCGICQEICEFNALAVIPPRNGSRGGVMLFERLCHGCGACAVLCPQKAIREIPRKIGTVQWGVSGLSGYPEVSFVHGMLDTGQALAPPVIRQVKQHLDSAKTVIIDAPPGTSCPVVEAVKGSDYTILVTEPTPFGLHDLLLAVDLLTALRIPFGVVINRAEDGNTSVEDFCEEHAIPILLRIPYSRRIAEAYSDGRTFLEIWPESKTRMTRIVQHVVESGENV